MHRATWVLTLLVAGWPALAWGQDKEAASVEYLRWLEERSMLRQAERASLAFLLPEPADR